MFFHGDSQNRRPLRRGEQSFAPAPHRIPAQGRPLCCPVQHGRFKVTNLPLMMKNVRIWGELVEPQGASFDRLRTSGKSGMREL